MESVIWVMLVKSSAADAFGVVTICLVVLLILLGFLCILHSVYFRTQVHNLCFLRLGYSSGPWVIRITLILFAIWWGIGEVLRLSFLRRDGQVLNALNFKWQETVCKLYIVSNLGFAEPCLFLTLICLLRAPLQKMESRTLSQRWNGRTIASVLLCCLPVFVLQLLVILIGPELNKQENTRKLPYYFTRIASTVSKTGDGNYIALCTYPLLSTILLGLFASFLTMYLFWVGRRLLNLVINKNLQKRVYTLIFSVSGFLPLRVVLLGLSVLSRPEHFPFEALAFFAFLSLLWCAGAVIFVLVYWPVADSLALRNLLDLEASRRLSDGHNDTVSLVASQSCCEVSVGNSVTRNSDASMQGSISFRVVERDEISENAFVELSVFSPSQRSTPPGSPQLIGWSPTQIHRP